MNLKQSLKMYKIKFKKIFSPLKNFRKFINSNHLPPENPVFSLFLGFSLIELLTTVGIIGALSGIAIPSYVSYKNNSKKAGVEAALTEAYDKIKSNQLLDTKTKKSELNQIDLVKANIAKGGSGWKINNNSAKQVIDEWDNSWCLEISGLGFKAKNGSTSSCITESGKVVHGKTCGGSGCTFTATTSCTGGQVFDGVKCICPAGQIFDGSKCITAPICIGGKVLQGTTCVCPSGTHDTGSACVTCKGGQVWNGSSCSCPSGQTLIGSTCQCPGGKILQGTTCVCPSGTHDTGSACVTCKGGQVWNGSSCSCPSGQTLIGSTCQCPGGKILQGTTCVCPSGTHDTGSACVTCKGGQTWDAGTKTCKCPAGQTLVGSTCQCPTGQIWDAGTKTCKCPAGQTLVGSTCQCPTGQTWDAGTKTCVTCSGKQVWNAVLKRCTCPTTHPYFRGGDCRRCSIHRQNWTGVNCVTDSQCLNGNGQLGFDGSPYNTTCDCISKVWVKALGRCT